MKKILRSTLLKNNFSKKLKSFTLLSDKVIIIKNLFENDQMNFDFMNGRKFFDGNADRKQNNSD